MHDSHVDMYYLDDMKKEKGGRETMSVGLSETVTDEFENVAVHMSKR